MKIHDYLRLLVWQKSIGLVENIYKVTNSFPKAEIYGLKSQIRRAAISVPSNIAEGSKRGTSKDFANFLRTALGSTSELETQLILAMRLKLLLGKEGGTILEELGIISRMINKLIESLINPSTKY